VYRIAKQRKSIPCFNFIGKYTSFDKLIFVTGISHPLTGPWLWDMYNPMGAQKRIPAADRFDPSAVEQIRREIEEADGREVLCIGKLDGEGKVAGIHAVAHGSEQAVPALYPHMEKGDVVIHNHPGGNLAPSDADISVASRLGNEGIGFFIVDNKVSRVYIVAEPVPVSERKPLAVEKLKKILAPGGALSKTISFYEPRPMQVDMLETVGTAFNEGGICIVEAGTGVGKSLAYLLPALDWAIHNEERVVVSTATINLQEQLYMKDIPLVQKLLHRKVEVALVKGRGNYLCWNRLEEALEEASLFEEEEGAWVSLKEWAKTTPTGTRGDLSFPVSDAAWSQVCSESDICTGLHCLHREKCFFLKSRREAAAARVLIANHHLVFSDLSFRIQGAGFESAAVLPPFQRIIFDEAHNLEHSATSFFSETLNRFSLFRSLNRLLRSKGSRRLGLAVKLSNMGASGKLIARMGDSLEKVRDTYLGLEGQAFTILEDTGTLRLTGETLPPQEDEFCISLAGFQRAALSLAEILGEILSSLREEDRETAEAYEGRMILNRIERIGSLCEQFRSPSDNPDRVLWIERRRLNTGDPVVEFHSTPLEITGLMQEAVYEPFETVIFTSATLTVNRSFSFWKSRMGITKDIRREVFEHAFDSPFDYKKRVLIGIPSDAPPPESEEYLSFLQSFLLQAIELTEGRALVLFTSYEMLSRVYSLLKPGLEDLGLSVYRQGEEERSRLLRKFTKNISSVLFATESFWEGIDAPGQTLEMVVLCRLPFRVPTEPVQVARMEAIRKRGGNPFLELSLPEAVMKLRQGFGRLMRRTTDRGIILIPDVRIVSKSYGKLFIASLPDTQRSIKEAKEVLKDIENFLASVSSFSG
jgi:ATP-dependent DNA helicase DinG